MENLIRFVGKLHPLIVHLPIGILIMALVLALLSRRSSFQISNKVISLVLLCGALSALAACIPGLILAGNGGYDETTLSLHKWLGIATAVLSIKSWFLYTATPERYPIFRFWIAHRQTLLLLTVVALSAAGHYGGSLTHGENYLTFSTEGETGSGESHSGIRFTISDPENAKVYEDIIRPILRERCENCHGATKKKGDLALHTPEAILAGGKEGKILIKGKSDESELYKRLILPEGDDNRMPPKGRPGLTDVQIQLIAWWINQGAPFESTVKELKVEPKIISLVQQLSAKGTSTTGPDTLSGVAPPKESDVMALREKGLKVLPLNPGSSFYQVNAINAPDFNDNDVALLGKLESNIQVLKLDRTQITDKSLQAIAKFGSLRQLSLRKTKITDAGLQQLAGTSNLNDLNLSETSVTDKGISLIASIKKLKKLYLFQTQVNTEAVAPLIRKGVTVELGNYQLEKLPSDTANY